MTLLIRRVSTKDAAALAHHMSDPAVFGGLLQLPYPSEESWHQRLTDQAAAANAGVKALIPICLRASDPCNSCSTPKRIDRCVYSEVSTLQNR